MLTLKFDAPIGYPSITANYLPEWEQWWFNPENVDLYQFMGKDNAYFHTVLFPSMQIADGRNWTKLHHLSATGISSTRDTATVLMATSSRTFALRRR